MYCKFPDKINSHITVEKETTKKEGKKKRFKPDFIAAIQTEIFSHITEAVKCT